MNIVFSNFLKKEMQKWQNNHIIDDENIAKLQNFYKFENLNTQKFSFTILAYLCFGLALITLIGANWEEIPKFIRLITVLGIFSGVQILAIFAYKNNSKNQAIGLFFLGNLCFGASIALISQIYHLGGNASSLFFWWAFGVMLVNIAISDKFIAMEMMVLVGIWMFLQADVSKNDLAFYLIFLASSVFVLIRQKSYILLLLVLTLTYSWIDYIFFNTPYSDNNEYIRYFIFPSLYMLYLFAISLVLQDISPFYSEFLQKISIYSSVIFVLNLHYIRVVLFKYLENPTWINFTICLIFILPLVYVAFRYKNTIFLTLFFIFCLNMLGLYQIVFDILITITSIIYGIILVLSKYSVGYVLIILSILIRYFNLAGDYIGTSLLFLICGILIIFISKKVKNEA